jgi:TATA-box binding protein (TBP) (component of TFIID and TFIIIB)
MFSPLYVSIFFYSYEPELHPGVTYKLTEPKATLKIFSTGSITVTAHRVQYVQIAIEQIFPLVYEFKKPKPLGKNDQSSLGKPENALQR